ncbi:MAG: phosphoglycerate mutase (2,3-diphosphoglycerate-independent) [Marinobacter sp.]|nr:MAG: phosphoglycerate mutase (2,3-diphosphoglycerate-independent) [Marinobacter sp.]
MKKTTALIILDGWGYSESPDSNAIMAANTPTWDKLWNTYPKTLVSGSGTDVGLPDQQMGNSEVGHLNLGSGRVVYQDFSRISKAIEDGSFHTNPVICEAIDKAIKKDASVHIMGLLSDGGVHSHIDHIKAAISLATKKGANKVYFHAFLDGRDTPPRSAEKYIAEVDGLFASLKSENLGLGQFASISGRYYAMDRDHRWPRVQAAYDLITQGKSEHEAPNAQSALEAAYARDESDEFVQATRIVPEGESPVELRDGDVLIFMNYRSDRARQITRAFIEPDFNDFERGVVPQLGAFVSLTEYSANFDIPVAFPPDRLKNVFGEYISNLGLRQLRIAETEKYAHVTFFFNGGREEVFDGEDRILVQSPDVATYDLQPEMNAPELTDKLVEAILSKKYDTIICNYANPDMVGHTGNMKATIKAIEALDTCLARVVTALESIGGEALITADHGNAEQLYSHETGQAHTAHTVNPVPLIYVGRPGKLAESGALCDIAPTMLTLMGLDIPEEMGGHCLVSLDSDTPEGDDAT